MLTQGRPEPRAGAKHLKESEVTGGSCFSFSLITDIFKASLTKAQFSSP